jgi:hypothetical protein
MNKSNYCDELWKDLGKRWFAYDEEQEASVYRKVGPLMYKLCFGILSASFQVFMGKWIVIEVSERKDDHGPRKTQEEYREEERKYRLELKGFANEYIKLFHGLKDSDFIPEEIPERDIIDEVFVSTTETNIE